MYRIGIAAILLAAFGAPVAAEEQPLSLEPSSAWTLNYGTEKCSLMRRFGSGDAAATLQIDSFGAWNDFHVLLYGTAVAKQNEVFGTAHLRLTGDPEESDADSIQGTVGNLQAISFGLAFIPYDDPRSRRHMTARERARDAKDHAYEVIQPQPDYDSTIDSLSIRSGFRTKVHLNLGNMAKPLAALRECVDALVKSWGGDPQLQRTLTRQAKPVESTVKKVQADYPEGMLRNGLSAYVPVRLSVDAGGHPSNCVVQLDNVQEAFRQAVCSHLAGSFEPALDKDGHAVASIFHTAVIYRIED